jgi:flagellar protein FliS
MRRLFDTIVMGNMIQNKSAGIAYKRQPEKVEDIHPVKLIYMLYERAIAHVQAAETGIVDNDLKKRGENLSKAIAIVTELNASIKPQDDSKAANFLRALYAAILQELPRISVSGELQNLRLAHGYLTKLKDLWEDSAMVEAGLLKGKKAVSAGKESENHSPEPKSISVDV